ncbi:MAG: hypothetical protein QM526_00685 [Alphaproteobacteria bacterium]|nr:hypothetical protein [Alphaproteobacteria bacterium]
MRDSSFNPTPAEIKKYKKRFNILLLWLIASAFLLITHSTFLSYQWYEIYPLLDIITHWLGGVISGFGIWYGYTRIIMLESFYNAPMWRWGSIIAVVIVWEFFEVFIARTEVPMGSLYWIDTGKDMMVGLFGAYGAYYVISRI